MDARYRLIRPGEEAAGEDDLVMRGLRVLMGGPEQAPGVALRGAADDITKRVNNFLGYAQAAEVDPWRQVLALTRDEGPARVAGMCLWVPARGKTAMLFAPAVSEYPEAAAATEAAIAGAIHDARQAGVTLVQALMEPADAAGKTVFAAAGLVQLATLTYMERRPPIHPPVFELPPEFHLAAYEAATEHLFRAAIIGSYEGSLDCPALSGMRAVPDVMEGHKGVGVFDPQLWSVVLQKEAGAVGWEKPVGCLLLAEIPARRALELVYLGLAPEVRGHGLGRILMQRVLAIASRRHFEVATLAVDAANVPAARLYRRCGYASVAQRVAMVKQLA